MRFTVSDEAIKRLGLPEMQGRTFDAPKLTVGLGAFTHGERRWAKKAVLEIDLIQDIDVLDALTLFYFLAVRRADPKLLTREHWPLLTPADFEIEPHRYVGELGTCPECGEPVRALVHDVPEDDDAA